MTYSNEKIVTNCYSDPYHYSTYVPEKRTRKDRHVRTFFHSDASLKCIKKQANRWFRKENINYYIYPYKKGKVNIQWFF